MSKLTFQSISGSRPQEEEAPACNLDEAYPGLRSGDAKAWKAAYDEFYPRVFRHVTYMTHRASLAEDLAQDVFVQAMKSIGNFQGRSSFSTWLFSITNRLVYKHWRKTGRKEQAYKKVSDEPQKVSSDDPDRSHLDKQRAQALREALTRVPDNLREAFILVDVQQLSQQQAAERLGITKGNLAVRASRARVKIREELEKAGWIEPKASSEKEASS